MKNCENKLICPLLLLFILLLGSSCSLQTEESGTAFVPSHTVITTEDFSTESQTAGVEESPVSESSEGASAENIRQSDAPFYMGRYYEFSDWLGVEPLLRDNYLDESAGFITSEDLPSVILDCHDRQPAFYVIYDDQGALLYSLEGKLLCRDEALYLLAEAFGGVIMRDDALFDPYTQTVICDDAEKLEPINEKQALIIYSAPEDQYAQTIRGIYETGAATIKSFPLGDGFKYESTRDSYLLVKNPEGDYLLLGENWELMERFSGEEFRYCNLEAGGVLELYAEEYIELLLFEQGRRYRLTKGSDLYRNEGYFYYFTNGHCLWTMESLYNMDGSLIKKYDEVHHLYKEDRFIVRDGYKLALLNKEGEMIKKIEIPGLRYTYMRSYYDNFLICEVATAAIDWRQELDRLYSLELEPITDKWYTSVAKCGEHAFWVHEIDLETEEQKALIIDWNGEVIMEEPRRVGSADDFAIAVEKGMYVGLIDYQGQWIAKRKFYEAPWYQWNDD